MTNDLAIRILTGDVLGTTEQTKEAVTMAVRALSKPNVTDTNVGDTISRQAAIDAFEKRTHIDWESLKILHPMFEVLEDLPSAERREVQSSGCEYWDSESNFCSLHRPSAEHWIPVTERLPETEDMYLVTRFNGKPMLDVAWFYIDEEGSGYFSCDLGDFAYVTAWMMPLPEPYKGGVQEWTMIL